MNARCNTNVGVLSNVRLFLFFCEIIFSSISRLAFWCKIWSLRRCIVDKCFICQIVNCKFKSDISRHNLKSQHPITSLNRDNSPKWAKNQAKSFIILHVIKLIFVRSHFSSKLANVSAIANFLEMRFLILASNVFQELRHFDVLTPFYASGNVD